MKKIFLTSLLVSAFALYTKAERYSCYVGCLHGRYFIAKYDAQGHLVDAKFGLDCYENWCIQVYLVTSSSPLPVGSVFDHETENRLNSSPVQDFVHPNISDAEAITESVKNKTGYTYVSADALNPEIRNFLFNY